MRRKKDSLGALADNAGGGPRAKPAGENADDRALALQFVAKQ